MGDGVSHVWLFYRFEWSHSFQQLYPSIVENNREMKKKRKAEPKKKTEKKNSDNQFLCDLRFVMRVY